MLDALEDSSDIAALEAAAAEEVPVGKEVYRANCLPVELVERMIIGGETPLRVWREHRKMTLAALSAASGVSSGYISEIEKAVKPGSVRALAKLATALDLSIDDLVVMPC